jgi:recombinational DNA repair protein (RecF pathway)
MTAPLNRVFVVWSMLAARLQPLEPYPGANKHWRCRCLTCGRQVTPKYNAVQQGRGGCIWCAQRIVDPTEAEALMRKAGLEPQVPYPGANAPWRCTCQKCGREVTPSYGSIRSGQGGCIWCAGKRVDPEQAVSVMRAAGLEPLERFPGANHIWRCRCTVCGREVRPSYTSVSSRGTGCSYCSRTRVDASEAVAAMRAVGLEPLEPYRSSAKPWRCRCVNCGREVSPSWSNIRSGVASGCFYCSGARVHPEDAEAAMRAANLEPLEPFPGASRPWRSRCLSCMREVRPKYATIRGGDGGCRFCGHNEVDPAEAEAVMRAAGLEPLEPYRHGKAKWRCRCVRCGREVWPMYNTIQVGDGGCGYCAGIKVDPQEAAELMRVSGLEPLVPYPGGKAKWPCRCLTCGRTVEPQYNKVQQGRNGCTHCSKRCPRTCACRRSAVEAGA